MARFSDTSTLTGAARRDTAAGDVLARDNAFYVAFAGTLLIARSAEASGG